MSVAYMSWEPVSIDVQSREKRPPHLLRVHSFACRQVSPRLPKPIIHCMEDERTLHDCKHRRCGACVVVSARERGQRPTNLQPCESGEHTRDQAQPPRQNDDLAVVVRGHGGADKQRRHRCIWRGHGVVEGMFYRASRSETVAGEEGESDQGVADPGD